MFLKRLRIAAVVVVGVGTTGIGLAAYQAPDRTQGTRPTAPRSTEVRLPPEASVIYKYVKLRKPNELNWQRIPWMVDLAEAIRVGQGGEPAAPALRLGRRSAGAMLRLCVRAPCGPLVR